MDFSKIATDYDKRALVQASAGERLLTLLEIKDTEDVLDLGCGTGSLTAKIRNMTRNQRYYDVKIDRDYIERFRKIVKDSFQRQAGPDGRVNPVFNRLYIIGQRRKGLKR
jgi:16S rRNA A1518/A1519 N6-dimethyltransferase RsmA/KsgA/DIM1 with predicted DNA glycosylase/AP lyase activity